VRLDQCSVSALTQRLCGHSSKSAFYRQRVIANCGEPFAQRFEGMQPDLAEPLPLDKEPLVIPVWEEILGEQLCSVGIRPGGVITEGAGHGQGLMEVHSDRLGQAQVR
jgi:hypothetical protein